MTRLLVVFALALVVRLGYVGLVYDGPASLMKRDSAVYLALAQGIVEQGGFGRAGEDGFRPETGRLPGYPAWLALFRVAWDDPLAPVLGQSALDAFTCVLIALLAARLDPRLGFAAGLFAAINPTMITSTGYVLTDSLFLFLFAGWLLATVDHMVRPTSQGAVLAGLLLGLATLTRAVTQFAVPLFALAVVAAALRGGARPARAIGHGALALALCLAVLAPVALRNLALFGHLTPLTTQGGGHALRFVAPAALKFAAGVPIDDARLRMAERLAAAYPERATNPFVTSAEAAAVAREALFEIGVVGLGQAWVTGAAINLAAPSLVQVPGFRSFERPSFYATPGDNALVKAFNVVRSTESPRALVLLVGAAAVTAAIRLVQLVGLARVGRRLLSLPWLFLLGVALYVLVVTGPVTGVKYRLPLEPLLTILFALGLVGRRRTPAPAESAAPPATTPPTARS
jgi:hypothetical protein